MHRLSQGGYNFSIVNENAIASQTRAVTMKSAIAFLLFSTTGATKRSPNYGSC
ncbi:MAG TPA: hypothetical protein V6D14_13050 [Coleofasciculaceae cyanobacterium]